MSKKDYIKEIDENAERRFFSLSADQIEVREEGDIKKIEGLAAVVNKSTDLGWYEERIAKGAFKDVMHDDVRALFNHDPNLILARSNNGEGTLELFINDSGDLGYRYETPDRQYAKDLEDAIRSGDVSQSSFAFTIEEEEWKYAGGEDEKDVRTIKKLKRLYDVSPVTYPAYQDTTVAARSLEKSKAPEEYVQDSTERDADLRELNF